MDYWWLLKISGRKLGSFIVELNRALTYWKRDVLWSRVENRRRADHWKTNYCITSHRLVLYECMSWLHRPHAVDPTPTHTSFILYHIEPPLQRCTFKQKLWFRWVQVPTTCSTWIRCIPILCLLCLWICCHTAICYYWLGTVANCKSNLNRLEFLKKCIQLYPPPTTPHPYLRVFTHWKSSRVCHFHHGYHDKSSVYTVHAPWPVLSTHS